MTVPTRLRELDHGQHCCMIFGSRQEQIEVTVPFLALGLERGERSVFVADDASVGAVWTGLLAAGVDVEKEMDANLLVLSSKQEYLDNDSFNPGKMLRFLQDTYDSTLADGLPAMRATGDVSWQIGPRRDFRDVIYYEALLDEFFTGKRMIGMCQYPRYACPPEVLTGVLNTHKVAAIEAELCENPHYLPPQLLLEKDPAARESKRVEWLTSQLLRASRAEQERDRLQAQLLQSQKVEAIGQLAGGVAHDFNNILTAVMGYSQLIRIRPGLEDAIGQDAGEIEKAARRGASLTHQLLAFERELILVGN